MKKKKIFYYSDVFNDDFGTPHERPNVYDTYKFKRKGFDKFLCDFFAFAIATPLIYFFTKLLGYRYRNKDKLFASKKLKTGYFIYSNHVGKVDVMALIIFGLPRRIDFVGNSDPLTIPVARNLVRALGFIPLPTDPHDLIKYQDILYHYSVEHNEAIVFFPEAHIWPEYKGLREFKSVSFRYPAKFNRPILPVFFLRKPKKGFYKLRHKNPVDVYVGDFIFPKPEYSVKENEIYLHDACFHWMKNLLDTHKTDSIYEYVYVPKEYNPNYAKNEEEL